MARIWFARSLGHIAREHCWLLTYTTTAHAQTDETTELVSAPLPGQVLDLDSQGMSSALSADGKKIAFSSSASTLVAGDTNGLVDVFVRDMQNGIVTRVSVDSNGQQVPWSSGSPSGWFGPALSANGQIVAFDFSGDTLVPDDHNGTYDVFVRDLNTGQNNPARPSLQAGKKQTDIRETSKRQFRLTADMLFSTPSPQILWWEI